IDDTGAGVVGQHSRRLHEGVAEERPDLAAVGGVVKGQIRSGGVGIVGAGGGPAGGGGAEVLVGNIEAKKRRGSSRIWVKVTRRKEAEKGLGQRQQHAGGEQRAQQELPGTRAAPLRQRNRSTVHPWNLPLT